MTDKMTTFSASRHFDNLRTWLKMEGEAERKRMEERRRVQSTAQAERSGETLLDMVIRTHTIGLGGRYLVTFQKRKKVDRLPWHRLKSGSPVIVSAESGEGSLQAVVSGRRSDSIEVAIDQFPEGETFRIDLSPDEVTRKRQQTALDQCESATGRTGQLHDLLLYERAPTFGRKSKVSPSPDLNDSQRNAVEFAMSANDIAIIHGPPGTGKTTTVVDLICQAVANGERVLACAPSNTAVDNLLERLIRQSINVVRLGHPARVHNSVRERTLDALVERHDAYSVIHDMMREAEQLERRANRFTRAKPAPGQKYQQRQEARELRRNARLLERNLIKDVIADSPVICATTSFDFAHIEDHRFDLLVVDEACQTVEPGCWVPLKFADRIVLAGDHCQLPPTILSQEAASQGYAVSLMQRLVEHWGESTTRLLTTQYRMHETIMRFSSDHFYDSELVADSSVADHKLSDLPTIHSKEMDESPVVFIDTAGAGWDEELEPEGLSKRNPEEGRLVLSQVTALCEAGLSPREIAVIAPYAAQVRWLRQHCEFDKLEIDTVDGFQGREKEAVVMCTVRSNNKGEVGFLADARRMNVALTRAKRKLVVVGDSATLGADPFFEQLLTWFETVGAYRSVWEFCTPGGDSAQ